MRLKDAEWTQTFPATLLDRAAALVRGRVGLVFPQSRRAALQDGLTRAMSRVAARDPTLTAAAYLARAAAEPDLLDDLVGEITVGETYFLREPRRWDWLRAEVLPPLLRRAANRPLRLWSAGCASGEEAYSLAIALQQAGWTGATHILATDISRPALHRGAEGIYTSWSLRGVPDEIITSYFEVHGKRHHIRPELRTGVEFRYLNLVEDSYPSLAAGVWGMDIILCRNVLIYFDDETTRRVSARLLASLADDGVLILGASDPLLTDADGATASVSDAGLVYRRRLTGSPGSALSHAEPVVSVPPPIPAAPPPPTPSVAPLPPPLRPAAAPATTVEVAVASVLGAYASADYGAAALRARQALAKGADDTRLHILLVRALANQGRLTEANEGLTAAHATHRLSPELVYLEAVLHLEAGRPADAVEAARRAIYLDPAFVLAHLSLGDAFARLGRHADARRAWRNAERTLRALPPDAIVEASDGERADRLLAMVRARIALISTERA